MIATASVIECDAGVMTPAQLPNRWMWIRSATSTTCGMVWLMRMTGRPRLRKSSGRGQDRTARLDGDTSPARVRVVPTRLVERGSGEIAPG